MPAETPHSSQEERERAIDWVEKFGRSTACTIDENDMIQIVVKIARATLQPTPSTGVEEIAVQEARRCAEEYRLNPQVYEKAGGKHPIQEYIEDAIKRAVAAVLATKPTHSTQHGTVIHPGQPTEEIVQ